MQLDEKQLKPKTLSDLVEPLVEVDMYTPKIQQDSVVIVFRVKHNYDAAYDLSSFIEKLPFGMLDTEAQEIPNADGIYEVFCELERDVNLPSNLVNIIDNVNRLTGEQEWMANYYQEEEPIALDQDSIEQHVRLVPALEIKEFMEMSTSTPLFEGAGVMLKSNTHNYDMIYTNVKEITEEDAVTYMREGWEFYSGPGLAIFGPNQYGCVTTKRGLIVEHNGKHLLFI